jgi:oxalate decarboxylase/phosphoglucose isomerase-like protein (cupin superfamily)
MVVFRQLADGIIDVYQDISLNQWLALTPPDLVKAHLGLSDATVKKLTKTKLTIVGPK